ncbi:hypothetical protein WAI453_008036 [Rhynchosporium graminicola]
MTLGDCKSLWQYLKNVDDDPGVVYLVLFAAGQPRIDRATAVVVGILTEKVEDKDDFELIVEVEAEDVKDAVEVAAEASEDKVDCAETEEEGEITGTPEVRGVGRRDQVRVSLSLH